MKKFFLLLAVVLMPLCCFSQGAPRPVSTPTYVPPVPRTVAARPIARRLPAPSQDFGPVTRPSPDIPIVVSVGKNLKPIEISKMDIKVEVLGNTALTHYDITFYNPNSTVLEGEFDFALSQDQSVYAFALDIEGSMREGVAVEKEKGRVVFEEIVKRNVDPGLLEKTADNHFKARVYPFLSKGSRRVQVSTQETLKIDGGNYYYFLPLNFKSKIKDFSLNVEIVKQNLNPVLKDNPLDNFEFKNWNNSFTASFKEKDYLLTGKLSFALPVENVLKVFSFQEGDKAYFFTSVPVNMKEGKKQNYKEISIIWDTSSSMESADKEVYFKFLEEFFKEYPKVEVNFFTFNIEASKKKTFTVKNGDFSSLKKHIEGLTYDGGTNLQALKNLKVKGNAAFLFSDALDSFGQKTDFNLKIKTYAFSAAASYAGGMLNTFCDKTGGKFINLKETSPAQALADISYQQYRLLGIDYAEDTFEEVFPITSLVANGSVNIAGILKKNSGYLNLNFGFDPADSQKQSINITKERTNKIARNVWAQAKINSLSLYGEAPREEIVATAKKYTIVTDYTSLIVLEDIADYVNNEILPPAELMAEYERLISRKISAKSKEEVLAEAAKYFEEVKTWWNRDFAKEKAELEALWKKRAEEMERRAAEREGEFYSAAVSDDESAYAPALEVSDSFGSPSSMAVRSSPSVQRSVQAAARPSVKQKEEAFTLSVKAWRPDTPYLKEMKKTDKKNCYKKYLELKKEYINQPSFYVDMASFFQQAGDIKTAVLVISNVSELKTDNAELIRITAQKLLELKEYSLAVSLFEYLAKERYLEPQSFRDLAFAYEQAGNYQGALDNYYKVIERDWKGSSQGVKIVVFSELNRIISKYGKKVDIAAIDNRFIYAMPFDVRIVLAWSADSTDIDLHVTDPDKEECYYSNKITYNGGKLSYDITGGYGPEEFVVKKALNGEYKVSTNYFGDSRQKIAGPVTLYIDFYTNYATNKEQYQRLIIRANEIKDKSSIGSVTFGKVSKKDEESVETVNKISREGALPMLPVPVVNTLEEEDVFVPVRPVGVPVEIYETDDDDYYDDDYDY